MVQSIVQPGDGMPTALRNVNEYDEWIGWKQAHLTQQQVATVVMLHDLWNRMLSASATAPGFSCVDAYHASADLTARVLRGPARARRPTSIASGQRRDRTDLGRAGISHHWREPAPHRHESAREPAHRTRNGCQLMTALCCLAGKPDERAVVVGARVPGEHSAGGRGDFRGSARIGDRKAFAVG